MTRDANKITRILGLTIMQANKNFKSNRLLRIFGRSNSILKTIVEYLNQLGMTGYSVSARINRRSIQVTKNSKAVSSKDSRNNRENFGVSCNNKINWETLYEWRVYVVIHRGLSMEGNCISDGTKYRENIGEYLRILLVQQTIICNKGLSRRKLL